MGLREEIAARTAEIFTAKYNVSESETIPRRTALTFGSTAKKIWARVLYIDLRRSRQLLSDHTHRMALRAHKAFLYATAKCVRAESGEPRSFGGDSVLSFFAGRGSDTAKRAVRAAMKTRWALDKIVNPALKRDYDSTLDFGIGVAQGEIHVGKSGIAGDEEFQDLVWIGWPVYLAVEYGEKASKPYAVWISDNIWKAIEDDPNMTHSKGESMWIWADETLPNGSFRVYKTSYWWSG